MTDAEKPDKDIPIIFEGYEDVPIMFANNFLVQQDGPELLVLTVGQATLPIFYGTEEEKQQQRELIESISGRTIARIALTHSTFRMLADLFRDTVAVMDKRGVS